MSSKTPTTKQISLISIVPQLIAMGIIMLLWYLINSEKAILYGASTYLAISLSLRNLIPKNHKNKMKKVKIGILMNQFLILKKVMNFSIKING